MTEHEPPTDDVLMRYANGTLPASERAVVDAWLRDHPDWGPRLTLHRALGDAMRHGTAEPGTATAFSALWSAVEERPVGDVVPLGPASPRRRRAPWIAAAAGAIAAALVAVLVLVGPGSGPEPPAESGAVTEATAPGRSTSTTTATTATAPVATDLRAVRDAVAASRAQGTARGRLEVSVSLADAADIAAAEARGQGPVGQVTGTASIEFPDRWSLETVVMVESIEAYADAQITQSLVGSGSSLQVHCGTGFEPLVDIADAGCPVVPLGTTFLSPTGVFDVIETADDAVFAFETGANGPGRRYTFTAVLAIGDAEPTEIAFDVDVLDDGNVIEMVQARTQYRATPDTARLDLWLIWRFDQYGVPVTIPAG